MEQRDLSVYDFNPEDELSESCQQWSKLSNPKFDSDVSNAITKYRFLQHGIEFLFQLLNVALLGFM